MSLFSGDSCASCNKSFWPFQKRVTCSYCSKQVCASCSSKHRTQHRIGNDFPFVKNGEPGIMNYLLLQGKPASTASSLKRGYARQFIQQDIDGDDVHLPRCSTTRFMVDLGEGYSCHPSHYSLGYGSKKALCTPRHWLLQATNELKSMEIPDWDTLKRHENDTSLKMGENSRLTWRVECDENVKYRFFRVVQTGPNSYKSKSMIQAEEDWKLERLLWVAVYKNSPTECNIARLPRDVLHIIIHFLGRKRPKNSWSHVFCVGGFELFGKLFLPLLPSHASISSETDLMSLS